MMKSVSEVIYFQSKYLGREVKVHAYHSANMKAGTDVKLLIMQDGQDLQKMNFQRMFIDAGMGDHSWICLGVHAGPERKQEYGVIGYPDYMQRGNKADAYAHFILHECIPGCKEKLSIAHLHSIHSGGFSLGGLMAFDLAMEFPKIFHSAGVFSGSFWWRSKALEKGYVEERDRIMHAKIRTKTFQSHQRFFLQAGALDEIADRNKNGIIDSIDDTLGVIQELEKLGFRNKQHLNYLELEDGKHDIETWGRVMPQYLDWLMYGQ
jgi:enterochelin esterase-like enzyme